jgi:uncharacterized alpha-E superfamily protein
LHRIIGSSPGSAQNMAEKLVGRLKSELDYTDIDEVIQFGMHQYMDSLQKRLNQVDTAIGGTFFNLKPLVETSTAEQ